MPFKAPWSTRCSTTSHEQIVSAIELKLYASKNMQCQFSIGVSTLHSPESPRQAQEVARSSLAPRQTREGGGNKPKLNVRWSDFLVVRCE